MLQFSNFLTSALLVSCVVARKGQELEKFVAASTEDISKVFKLENELWSHLKIYRDQEASKKDEGLIKNFLLETSFLQVIHEDSLYHVSHPFYAYHCLKRTSFQWDKLIAKLSKQNKLKKVKQILRKFPEVEDFETGGAFGLMTLQLYYNISYSDMMAGNIISQNYLNLPPLEAGDAFLISQMAKHVQRLDKQVLNINSKFMTPFTLNFMNVD